MVIYKKNKLNGSYEMILLNFPLPGYVVIKKYIKACITINLQSRQRLLKRGVL